MAYNKRLKETISKILIFEMWGNDQWAIKQESSCFYITEQCYRKDLVKHFKTNRNNSKTKKNCFSQECFPTEVWEHD